MATIEVNGTTLYYEERGKGDVAVVFSHGLLMNGKMFDAQVDVLQGRYRCITYDHRGQGRSAVTPGGYDMDNLTRDAASLIRATAASPCHFVGMSMGGFVGLRLAIRHPELLRSLTLLDSSAGPEPRANIGPYRRLAFVGRWLGFGWVVDRVVEILFGRTFLSDPQRAREREDWRERICRNDRRGSTRAALGVIEREGVEEELDRIATPTLIVVGEEDVATPPDVARRMHDGIRDSRLVTVPAAGHTSNIEQPEAVNRALLEFFRGG